MSTLPQGWDSDYDGSRWFFIYRPTGQIQYHFPKPGDEFPDFIDSFSPAPVLLPEEKLESQQQVKRRSTTGSSSRAKAAAQRQREASALPVVDDEGGFEYSFESFGYLGPQSYNDVSPLNDEEEEDLGPGRADKLKEEIGKNSPANVSTPGDRPHVSPMTSAGTTPQVGNTEPASGTPILGEHITGESSTVPTIAEEPIMSEPIHSAPVLGVSTTGIPAQGLTQGSSQSPTVPMLDGTEISPPPVPAFSPVGYMPELYSESTAQCNEEVNPPPVELPDNAIWVEPIQTVGFINEHPVELPTQHSPVEKRQEEPATAPVGQASVPQTQYPYGISASFASATPPPEKASQPPMATQAQAENYQPWNPNQQISENSTKRGSVILGNMSIAESQRNELGALDSRRSPGSPTPPPKIDMSNVPAILAPPKVPPKRPIEDKELGESSKSNPQTTDAVHPLMPGAGARHSSISNVPNQIPGAASLSHHPSILKPGPRQGPNRTGGDVPSDEPFQQQQKSYMAYQPAHPMPGVPPVSYAQLIQPRQYQAMPPSDSHPLTLRPGSGQQLISDARPGVPRTNTVPNQLPSQAPPPMLTPPPSFGPNGHQESQRDATLQGPSLGLQRMSTGNIYSTQTPIVQTEHGPPANAPVLTAESHYSVIPNVINGSPQESNAAAAHSPSLNTSAPQRYSSPAQHLVMGDAMTTNSGRDASVDSRFPRTSEPPFSSNEKPLQGNAKVEEPLAPAMMGESVIVDAPVTRVDTPREPHLIENVQISLEQTPNPLGDSEPSASQSSMAPKPEHLRKSSESGMGQHQEAGTSVKGQEITPSFSVFSEEAGTKSYDPPKSMPVRSGATAATSQTYVQPSHQDFSSDTRRESVQVTTKPSAQIISQQHLHGSSQSTTDVQSVPEPQGTTTNPVRQASSGEVQQGQPEVQRISSPAAAPSPRPQETHVRHASQGSQQSYIGVSQPVPWVQTSQMPQASRSINSPVGPWSVANLPGMAVLQPNAPALQRPEQHVQHPSGPVPVYHQPPVQTSSPEFPGPPNLVSQQTAPRNDPRITSTQGPVQNPVAPKNNSSTETNQSSQTSAQTMGARVQTQVPLPQTTMMQKDPRQNLTPRPTSAIISQQSQQPVPAGPISQPQGQLPQQPLSSQGQRVQSPGVVSVQNNPQSMGYTARPPPQSGQTSQPQMIMGYRQQVVPGQQPQNVARVSLQSPPANSQSPAPGMPPNGSLPLQTGPTQQPGMSGSVHTTGAVTGNFVAGGQVPANLPGSQPAQSTPGPHSGLSQQPASVPHAVPQTQRTHPNQGLAGPSYGNTAPPPMPGQRSQMQGIQRPPGMSQQTGSGPVTGQVSSSENPHSQTSPAPQGNALPSLNQFSGQNLQMGTGNPMSPPPQMQNMQSSAGPGLPPGQIPCNPRMFPPMPTPLVTQPFDGQQPTWGQSGTPTQAGPQSPFSQRRTSQQSLPPASPSSRRASGYQIQPGAQSPVVPQQYQFPQSQVQPSSNTGTAGKEKNWFSKMWKNPSSKKGSISGGSVPSTSMGMAGAPGNAQMHNTYGQTQQGPTKLQKSHVPQSAQIPQQPQGYPIVYNNPQQRPGQMPGQTPGQMPGQTPGQMQGPPGSYGHQVTQGAILQPMLGKQQNLQPSSNHLQNPVSSQRGDAPPAVYQQGGAGQPQHRSQGVPSPNWPQPVQRSNIQSIHHGQPVGNSGQQPLHGQPIQSPSGQGLPQMYPGPQSHAGQPPNAQQQWAFNQGAVIDASGGSFTPNASMQPNQGAQYQGQPQAPQFGQQQPSMPQQQQQQPQQEGSGDFVAAIAAVAGAVGTLTASNAAAPPVDDSCVVAPLFSSPSQPASIPAQVDSSISGDSGYAVVDTNETVSIDIDTVSVDTNGNAWTATSIDYEGNDWGGTW